MAEEKPRQHVHEEHVILEFVDRHYPELKNRRTASIGLVGGIYRVAVIDQYHVNHTLKIDPKHIDADQNTKVRMDRMLAEGPTMPKEPGKDKTHER